jgi:hypothetical protein
MRSFGNSDAGNAAAPLRSGTGTGVTGCARPSTGRAEGAQPVIPVEPKCQVERTIAGQAISSTPKGCKGSPS